MAVSIPRARRPNIKSSLRGADNAMAKVLTCCSLMLLSASIIVAQQNETPPAKQILDKMVSVYGSCSSYADKGESREVFLESRKETLRPFSTEFIRPSR